jgi:ribosomal protein S18 acetylase RimI-like enzyme
MLRRVTTIERVDDLDLVIAASHLFDGPARADATRRFLAEPGHHILLALDDERRPVGMVTGVETTHPDKGTEMFLYELAVDEDSQRQGIGTALVEALADLGREHGCYGMWVLTDDDNTAALATYSAAGADERSQHVMLSWTFA